MPLVSGVCRTASAPMLSHGGSRLNASKPEANPKTRYPTQTNHLNTPSSAVVASELASNLHKLLIRVVDTPKGLHVVMTNQILRHSSWYGGVKASIALRLLLYLGILTKRFSLIESPHKPLPPARPRWRQVSHIITSNFSSHNKHTLSCSLLNGDLCKLHA